MVYSEKEYKDLEKFYKEQLKEMKQQNEVKEKEVKLLKEQNKQKDEIIHDLDRYDYKGQCQTLRLENEELKKKLQQYEAKFGLAKRSLEKDSSNSCKPSSTDGYKKVVQNNRVKSGKKPGREKGHKRSAPQVSINPDKKIMVSKVATCSCGHKTEEIGEVSRDLISIKIITYTTQYTGKKTTKKIIKKRKITAYYESEKRLIARLKEYVDDHLRFTTDFRIDFTNNLAERGLRKIKSKLKVAGSFRSLQYAKYYCDAISIIDTCKKQNVKIFETIKNIFMGKRKIFAL